MGIEKKCLCGKVVMDESGKDSVAAICDECRFNEAALPADVFPEDPRCGNCGRKINFIGAAVMREWPAPHPIGLYYDCSNSECSQKRMSFLFLSLQLRRRPIISYD